MHDESSTDATERVLAALPDWGNAIAQLNELIADRMGVVLRDLDCLHALNRGGPATTGELAARVGLTSGAASRMIDRLEDAGCARRVRDRADRRRVLVEPTEEGLARIRAYYDGLTTCTR
ncbi:MAG: MarR family transcriptional regulator, partial [Tomitella sp.]|nr:MarR family transcriptional regulator [Tomitella sp.]